MLFPGVSPRVYLLIPCSSFRLELFALPKPGAKIDSSFRFCRNHLQSTTGVRLDGELLNHVNPTAITQVCWPSMGLRRNGRAPLIPSPRYALKVSPSRSEHFFLYLFVRYLTCLCTGIGLCFPLISGNAGCTTQEMTSFGSALRRESWPSLPG